MKSRVEKIFHTVADLSAEAQARYFAEHGIETDVQKEVQQLLAFDSQFTGLIDADIGRVAEWTLSRFEPRSIRCGPYQLGSLVGRGGMGSVYSAERVDGEVTQRVAVKLLRPATADSPLRQRFLAERQILATLSHPNVAQLLDAGHREDGQPYLVMEFVEGQPIDVFATSLSLRPKVRLFLKVCTAVSYLHRNLVVHRDLKPSNILVTWEGEPKLLDFGIAKMLDLPAGSTETSMRILTPDYASPEQVTGQPVTTATDVYSLGAVLYKLLTGVPPHQFEGDSPGAIALAISSGKIAPLSKVAPALDRDLEMILMKALRKEPQERYASADALADDLRAFLDRRPVQARSGDAWYRTRKFLRRHWVSAAAAVLVITSLSAGLYIANRERAIAQRRFSQLRQLSDRIIDLDRSIRTLPGSIEARQKLVSASLDYLESLSREARGDVDLAQDISDGYWRMARIQGINAELNLGNHAKAEDNLKRADQLIETVLASRPRDRGALFRSAVISQDRMILADTEDRRADALGYAGKAVQRLQTFVLHDDPRNPVRLEGFLGPGDARSAERAGVATIYVNIALTYVNLHLYEDGESYARRGVELVRPIASARDIASQALSVLANALRYQGDLEGALSTIREAQAVSEQATYSSPVRRLFSRYGLLLREGRILGEEGAVNLGRPEDAIAVLQKALDMTEDAARNDPRDSSIRSRVATSARELGDILRDRDPQRALAVYDLGIRRLTEMPNSLKARRDRAQLLANSAYSLRRLHRVSEAKARIDTAFAILRSTKDYPADRIRLGSYDFAIVRALADHQADAGDLDAARRIYADLLDRIRASQPKPEDSLADAVGMSDLYATIAGLDRRATRQALGYDLECRRLELWRRWDAKLPNNSFIRGELREASKPFLQNNDNEDE